jgi:hypothetical protein
VKKLLALPLKEEDVESMEFFSGASQIFGLLK